MYKSYEKNGHSRGNDIKVVNTLGASFIEVLIALLIFSIGVLALVSLQLKSLNQTRNAYTYTVASVRAFSLLQRLQVNLTPAARQNQFTSWKATNKRLLSGATGNYHCQTNSCNVELTWLQNKATRKIHLSSKLSP